MQREGARVTGRTGRERICHWIINASVWRKTVFIRRLSQKTEMHDRVPYVLHDDALPSLLLPVLPHHHHGYNLQVRDRGRRERKNPHHAKEQQSSTNQEQIDQGNLEQEPKHMDYSSVLTCQVSTYCFSDSGLEVNAVEGCGRKKACMLMLSLLRKVL